MINKHALLTAAALFGLFGGIASAAAQEVEVWKSPSCGCCAGWVKHMEESGFTVKVHAVDDIMAVKAEKGVPNALGSCHTSVVEGYVIEGHVPAADVRRLLAERPQAKGLSAPGMPSSSPGMDIPGHPYEVVVFGTPDGTKTFEKH